MRLAAPAVALALSACANDVTHLHPMAELTRGLVPGDRLECIETVFRIGVPLAGDVEFIGYQKRTFVCTLCQ